MLQLPAAAGGEAEEEREGDEERANGADEAAKLKKTAERSSKASWACMQGLRVNLGFNPAHP